MVLSSCSQYEKLLKSNDVAKKLEAANTYYDNEKFSKANTLYEGLIPLLKGTKSFETIYYQYAYSFYNMKDYLSASYHFKNFISFFPNSTATEEMEFMHAKTLYLMAPKVTLDQSSTVKAMEAMQNYVEQFGNSKRIKEANEIIASGREKLEQKDLNAAKLYYQIGYYKSAVVYFENMLKTYPDSDQSDYYKYMVIRSQYRYAQNSTADKQKSRYQKVVENFIQFKEYNPNSKYLDEAEKLYARADQNIKQIQK